MRALLGAALQHLQWYSGSRGGAAAAAPNQTTWSLSSTRAQVAYRASGGGRRLRDAKTRTARAGGGDHVGDEEELGARAGGAVLADGREGLVPGPGRRADGMYQFQPDRAEEEQASHSHITHPRPSPLALAATRTRRCRW